MQNPQIAILTEGCPEPWLAKTAITMLRYRAHDIAAVIDSASAGKTAGEVFGIGGNIPVVASLDDVPEATELSVGIAPAGGRLPEEWRSVLRAALCRGMNIVSGLHDFIGDDAEFQNLAKQHGATIRDVRKNNERRTAEAPEIRRDCLRIHTVANDCAVGKMAVAVELDLALRAAGEDSKFVATGQTGIMVAGDGLPIDCVVSDFVNGAAETLVLENQQHEILVVEGQGSLAHPSFSAVTLGLLHGCAPDGLILCYEAGRKDCKALPHVPLKPLSELRELYETVAALRHPCQSIGIAINGRRLSKSEAEDERKRVSDELGLPACDVYRDGAGVLVQAVFDLRETLNRAAAGSS